LVVPLALVIGDGSAILGFWQRAAENRLKDSSGRRERKASKIKPSVKFPTQSGASPQRTVAQQFEAAVNSFRVQIRPVVREYKGLNSRSRLDACRTRIVVGLEVQCLAAGRMTAMMVRRVGICILYSSFGWWCWYSEWLMGSSWVRHSRISAPRLG
jgi:hypothetical protein